MGGHAPDLGERGFAEGLFHEIEIAFVLEVAVKRLVAKPQDITRGYVACGCLLYTSDAADE